VSSVQEGIERHEYDLYYIKNMSLLLDLRIIIETFKIVILGRGAR
jgi:lipopolysaccharide/colanic/teichoic acid biosynthesis glycosyltransferase